MRLITVLVALVALAPGAAAAALDADLRFHDLPTVAGDATVRAHTGALEIDPVAPWHLTFASAEGWLVTRALEYAGPTGGPHAYRGSDVRNDTLELAAGALHSLSCLASCSVLLVTGGDGALSLSGAARGAWGALDGARVHAFGGEEQPHKDGFLYRTAPGWFAAGGDGLALRDARASGEGDLTLFVMNATIDHETDEGTRRLDARRTATPIVGPLGVETGRRDEARFLVLHLRDARFDIEAGGTTLVAKAPSLSLAGIFASSKASGTVSVDGERHALDLDAFSASGAIRVAPRPEAAALPLADHPRVGARATGEADEVVVGGTPVARAVLVEPAAAFTLAAVFAALAAWKTGALAWLYTRLEPATLLRNPNRKRVHDAVHVQPGATVTDLVRVLGMTEVVVRHHLRILETHRFVVAKGEGKLRGFLPPGLGLAERAETYLTLRDGTRQRIAWALADAPAPLSQQEVAERVGVSPRLVSYHLGKLEREGLVTGEGSMPRRYLPSDRLRTYREGKEHAVA